MGHSYLPANRGAPVGVWHEPLCISNTKKHADLVGPPKPVLQDPRFEAARFATDNGIFRCYLHAMGGALAPRAKHPIKLAHLIEEQANAYSEDIKHLMGLHTARLGVPTRLTGWEVVPAGTFEATKAAEGSASGAGVKTGDNPAPWSSDNNCTRPDTDAFANQLMREQWGLSSFSIDRLRAGASVRADGFSLWLENGQLQSCRSLPSEPDWQLEGLQPDEQNLLDEYAVPEGDQEWPMLVELCGRVYQAQGHTGAHRWIEMLPEPYQSEMWVELEKLDSSEWMQEQDDYIEEWV